MLRDSLLDALAVLLPVDCPACGSPARAGPCGGCRAELAEAGRPGRRTLGPAEHSLGVVTGAAYSGVVRRLVLALKDEGRVGAAPPLAVLLRPALRLALREEPAVLVGPPGSYGRRLRRGYDPVDLIVRAAGGRPARPLRRARHSLDQVGLGRSDRLGNLDGAFRARRPLVDSPPILLVDDVVTSGATLLEMRRAVEAAGGRVRGAVAVAGTPLRAEAGLPGDSPRSPMILRMNTR
ncbi:ComF family protein [Rathayibacter sp. VKM Ac-2803]|uniref:ComF family protein n=1 Tax=Rathayibacter sp. VKM Ac-2803 TaxID=2609256 RepID=UPI00135A67FD|nr:ComF family protein [Rathayibacter sp. VKM Ac-2803]MWV50549.1 ComF family protein [Rathayibacter sp. VKM Ac-2803]